MVHELIGIKNGRVDLSNVPGIKPELKVIFSFPGTELLLVTRKANSDRSTDKLVFHIGK